MDNRGADAVYRPTDADQTLAEMAFFNECTTKTYISGLSGVITSGRKRNGSYFDGLPVSQLVFHDHPLGMSIQIVMSLVGRFVMAPALTLVIIYALPPAKEPILAQIDG